MTIGPVSGKDVSKAFQIQFILFWSHLNGCRMVGVIIPYIYNDEFSELCEAALQSTLLEI